MSVCSDRVEYAGIILIGNVRERREDRPLEREPPTTTEKSEMRQWKPATVICARRKLKCRWKHNVLLKSESMKALEAIGGEGDFARL